MYWSEWAMAKSIIYVLYRHVIETKTVSDKHEQQVTIHS